GIDVGYKVAKILHAAFLDRITPSKIIQRINADGRLGKKGGKGFYIYEGKNKNVDSTIYTLISDIRKSNGELAKEDIQDRLLFIMLIEAVHCLEEQIVRRSRDVDAGMIFGTGFPPFRGGLLKYADSLGLELCVEKIKNLQEKYGARFACPELLRKMVEKNQKFYEN
ncbi:MAG: 3-hydroxyacyl-CoA dehydrogenase family protein, partial [bacterium]